jgi:peptidyl-prolyl cis-trans isomerase D
VKDRVADDWKQDQRRRFQDQAATAMMVAVQEGKSFSDAATVAGVTPKLSPRVTLKQGSVDVPAELQRAIFGLKQGETTMVETPDGFIVGQLAEVVKPDAAADKAGYDQARAAISKSISNDLAAVFVEALRRRAKPEISQQAFDNVVQPR